MLTVREPAHAERMAGMDDRPPVGAFAYILSRWRGFGALFVGATCNFAMSTLTFWNVPLFQRTWGWSIARTGTVTGLFYFTAGPIGTIIAVWAMRRLTISHKDAAMRVLLIGLLIGVPTSALYPIMPSAGLAVAAMFVAFIGKSIATAGGPAALAMVTPGDIRTRAVAIFNTVITLVGPHRAAGDRLGDRCHRRPQVDCVGAQPVCGVHWCPVDRGDGGRHGRVSPVARGHGGTPCRSGAGGGLTRPTQAIRRNGKRR